MPRYPFKDVMSSYLLRQLCAGGESVHPCGLDLAVGGASLYLLGNDGALLTVYGAVGRDSFAEIAQKFASPQFNKSRRALVFLKGTPFFRSAARDNHFKADDLSLKNYSPSQINHMILLRPEEQQRVSIRPTVQYYQPASELLEEGLLSVTYTPVEFDYSHIDSSLRFKPHNRTSSKLFINTPRPLIRGPLVLEQRCLAEAPTTIQVEEGV